MQKPSGERRAHARQSVRRAAAASQRGFTLIELMISLVLFSLAVGGVMSVAVSFSNGLREQRATVGADASARLTLVALADALRQVSPGVNTGTIQDAGTCTTGALSV